MRSLALLLLTLMLVLSKARAEFSIDDATLFKIQFGEATESGTTGSSADSLLHQHVKEAQAAVAGAGGADPAVSGSPGDIDDAVTSEPPTALPEPNLETVIMKTKDQEEYTCTLPRIEPASKNNQESYTGKNALEILGQLFATQACAYRLEHYWTYELCHGRFIRQYHEERDGKQIKMTEYFLGKYDSDTYEKDLAVLRKEIDDGTVHKPQKMKIETMNMPFYQLTMKDGTICDLNGQPRETRVNYVCYPAGKHEMYSFKESSTCEYDVIVLSPTLCNHPDYRPEESNEHIIDCRPKSDASPPKPKGLVALEDESTKLRSEKMYEGKFTQGDKPGSVKIEIRPVGDDPDSEVITDEDLDEEAEAYKEENWPTQAPRQPFKPLMDPEVVKQFLMGEYCLYGGSGWWKYEFCYGKKVDQYHEERSTGQKTIINLGRFDEQKHLVWLSNNPSKRPKPVSSRKYVSHLYSNGDICDLTGQPRHVEVKLKCKKSDSPSAVTLYLLEPKTCEYVLGVESPLVCDVMHLADENGIMTIAKEDLDAIRPSGPDPPPSATSATASKTTGKPTTTSSPASPSTTTTTKEPKMTKIEEMARQEAEKKLKELNTRRAKLEKELHLDQKMYESAATDEDKDDNAFDDLNDDDHVDMDDVKQPDKKKAETTARVP